MLAACLPAAGAFAAADFGNAVAAAASIVPASSERRVISVIGQSSRWIAERRAMLPSAAHRVASIPGEHREAREIRSPRSCHYPRMRATQYSRRWKGLFEADCPGGYRVARSSRAMTRGVISSLRLVRGTPAISLRRKLLRRSRAGLHHHLDRILD